MPSAFLTLAMRYLQKQTVATFGGDEMIWWPASDGEESFTVAVVCAAPPNRGQSTGLAGLLKMDTDDGTFHCTLADFPFEPRPDHLFVFGPALSGAWDPATSRKFIVKTAIKFGELITLHADLHS